MLYSKPHPVADSPGVVQILVFKTTADQELYRQRYPSCHSEGNASANGIGAFLKLRVAKTHRGWYEPFVRCGVTGQLLTDADADAFEYQYEAFEECKDLAHTLIERHLAQQHRERLQNKLKGSKVTQ